MKLIFSLIIILIGLIYMNSSTSASKVKMLSKNDAILAFGDSLTYGYGAKSEESYPSLLSEMTGLRVINAGVNGDTSTDGLNRIEMLLTNNNIKLMILCFGGNDIIQRKSMSQLKQNLINMIDIANSREIKVVLVSVPNIGLFGLSPLELYDEVATETGTHHVSGVLADILGKPGLKSDQIHPNAKGYKLMAERIYENLKEFGYLD